MALLKTRQIRRPTMFVGLSCLWIVLMVAASAVSATEQSLLREITPIFQAYCFDCHDNVNAEAHINLEQLVSVPNYATRFRTWEKVAAMVREKRMPPADMPQPNDAERSRIADGIVTQLDHIARAQAGDPGQVTMRRLTSAEYAYTIQDLTGLKLELDSILIDDAVGGEGFTNIGDVQFVQDSTLERYVEAAKLVAAHAVLGTGPLQFFHDPGKTGLELSAIHRIQEIYRRHGFRTAAGEGGEPFGLDLFPRAFLVAWQFFHREKLDTPNSTLAELAADEGLDVRFVQHIWNIVNQPFPSYPISEITSVWRKLPEPTSTDQRFRQRVRQDCGEIARLLQNWQRRLARNVGDDEEAALLTQGSIHLTPASSFQANIDWAEGAETATVHFSVDSATAARRIDDSLVVWSNPTLRFRRQNRTRSKPIPLLRLIPKDSQHRLLFGPRGQIDSIADTDFVITGNAQVRFEIPIPADAIAARLTVKARLDTDRAKGVIVRCTVRDGSEVGDTAADTGEISAMLGLAEGAAYETWKAGVLDFASAFPDISQGEPAPSDRDPIPAPFDGRYNSSERNEFHYTIKYHRDDDFLVNHILDDSTRQRLDQAWYDLLSSFDYHDTYLSFIAKKHSYELGGRSIADLHPDWIAALPDATRDIVQKLVNNYIDMQAAIRTAQARHIEDALRFARSAWRRKLTSNETDRLRKFYTQMRESEQLSHVVAMRTLLTRILVAPAFLYRVENPRGLTGVVPLSQTELASRMSYFLWSSPSDQELLQAAEEGELGDGTELARQTQRMLRDAKVRRFATEFFGQWFGFYRFDDFRGIDADRFPEFDDQLKISMYDEAISFFEYIVREDRPIHEILFADYTYLNQKLARHYGLPPDKLTGVTSQMQQVQNVNRFQRGGLLRLGVVHAVTSAPLRTSAVKRGDWVLRRVLGTPVPPPPADAGSIPADDVLADGKTVRARLIAHRRDDACVNCHTRLDPLGFALENFDPLGRWRQHYRDGQAIDATATLQDGSHLEGIDGLHEYLRHERPKFYRILCSKLLGYALGRGEILSDKTLVQQMQADLAIDGRFSQLAVRIVTSPQFRTRRGDDDQ